MTNQTQKDTKPQREQWHVGSLRTSRWLMTRGAMILFISSWLWSSRLTIIDKKLTLKHAGDFLDGYQFSPQHVVAISPSKDMSLYMLVPAILLIVILVFFQGNKLPTVALVLTALTILIHVIPVMLFKCYRINHQLEDYPKYIYFCCLRHQSSSIMDVLKRCGFGDKLETKPVAPNPPLV